jgi:esterase/lipase superfamily enzyme
MTKHRAVLFHALFLVAACGSPRTYVLEMMPGPAYYGGEEAAPDLEKQSGEIPPRIEILYATDREPADEKDNVEYYRNERGGLLRLGVARVQLGTEPMDWDAVVARSFESGRKKPIRMKIESIEEFGILDRTITAFTPPERIPADRGAAARRFARDVNERLRSCDQPDIYIFVHGYKVRYENPVLVATELWHFLGYEGVFLAYSWPSTPSLWAYFSDLETGELSARNLRKLLTYLAEETQARRIHVLGYSAGTRLVALTLHQFALGNANKTREEIHQRLRLGQVVLTGSDIDRHIFGAYLLDGIASIPEHLTVYTSATDTAMGPSEWVFGRRRMGRMFAAGELSDTAAEQIRILRGFSIVNVTGAERADAGNGHAYFQKSPWVSSDLLATFAHGLSPGGRGLVREGDSPIWEFPPDYVEKLRKAVRSASPRRAAGSTPP